MSESGNQEGRRHEARTPEEMDFLRKANSRLMKVRELLPTLGLNEKSLSPVMPHLAGILDHGKYKEFDEGSGGGELVNYGDGYDGVSLFAGITWVSADSDDNGSGYLMEIDLLDQEGKSVADKTEDAVGIRFRIDEVDEVRRDNFHLGRDFSSWEISREGVVKTAPNKAEVFTESLPLGYFTRGDQS